MLSSVTLEVKAFNVQDYLQGSIYSSNGQAGNPQPSTTFYSDYFACANDCSVGSSLYQRFEE